MSPVETAVQPAIVADNAAKLFLDGAVVAFHQLSLQIQRDEIMCVVGPSGCGKTTFLRCIAGLTELSDGKLLVQRQAGGRPAARRRRHGVPAFRAAAVEDGLRQRRVRAGDGGRRRARRSSDAVGHYLELVGLAGFENHYPYQLSGGMQQRVGLVRALAMNPSVLLMDEPFAALDAQTREILQEELLHLMERPDERKTMVFITHSIDEAILLGDRIAVMSARPGRIKELLDVPFGRPRNVDDMRTDVRFGELRQHIWHQLHTAQAGAVPGAAGGRVTTIDQPRALPDAERALSDDKARAERVAGERRMRRMFLNLGIRLASVIDLPVDLGGGRFAHRSDPVHDAERGRQGRGRDDRAAASSGAYFWPSLMVLMVGFSFAVVFGIVDRADAGAVLGARCRVQRLHHLPLFHPVGRAGAADRAVGRLRGHGEGHHPVHVRLLPDGDQHLSGREGGRSEADRGRQRVPLPANGSSGRIS